MASFREEEQLGSMSAQKTLQFLNYPGLPKLLVVFGYYPTFGRRRVAPCNSSALLSYQEI
jgi:hypothetical protein